MKLLERSENKTTKDKKGKNLLHFAFTKVVLVNCNAFNNDYQQDS